MAIVTIELQEPCRESEMEGLRAQMAEVADGIIVTSPGFRGCYFLMPSPSQLVQAFLWDNEADLRAMGARAMPRAMEMCGGAIDGPPQRTAGEVLAQRVK